MSSSRGVKARRRPRHAPQRTCVSCGSTTAKRDLIRLVRTPGGDVQPDPTGKQAGRGAYLCHKPDCWERAVNKGRLANALRATLSKETGETLLRYGRERLAAEAS